MSGPAHSDQQSPSRAVRALRVLKLVLTVLVLAVSLWRGVTGVVGLPL